MSELKVVSNQQKLGVAAELDLLGVAFCQGGCGEVMSDGRHFCFECFRHNLILESRRCTQDRYLAGFSLAEDTFATDPLVDISDVRRIRISVWLAACTFSSGVLLLTGYALWQLFRLVVAIGLQLPQ